MIAFLLRIAIRSMVLQKDRFIALTVTIAVASALLVTLSSLYFNAESQLALGLSGIPNMTVMPKKSVVAVTRLTTDDVTALKSKTHFWRNNIVNAAPIAFAEGEINGKKVKIVGTWFDKTISIDNESYNLGLLNFKGWEQRGGKTDSNSVIVGANAATNDIIIGEQARVSINNLEKAFKVAKVLKTGTYWDDYIFLDLDMLKEMTGIGQLDQILVGALIKPKDQLAVKAELYGHESLSEKEHITWYCSPYVSSIAYTINEVIPQADVRVQRRITEVQEGIIRASSGVFAAMFLLTLVTSITAVFAGEKMYASSKMREFGIMVALGGSRQKIFLQLATEISLASLLSAVIAYLLSRTVVGLISASVFGISFQANTTLIATSVVIPFFTALVSMLFVRKGLEKDVVEIMR